MRAALLMLLAGCASAGPKPAVEFELPPQCKDAKALEPVARCVGALRDRLYLDGKHLVRDPALSSYVARVAARVARAAGGAELGGIRIIDDPDINAQAGLGNYIYVTRGALVALDSEAELAALLGHEIGHIVSGHMSDALSAIDAVELGRGTDEEQIADELAVKYVAAAGYDPNAVVSMLEAVISDGPHGDRYPPPAIRRADVALLATGGSGELGRERYLAAIDGLAVGRDRRNGAAWNDMFVSVRDGVVVRFGTGWTLTDGSDVSARGPGGLEAVVRASGPLTVTAAFDGQTPTRRRSRRGLGLREGWLSSDGEPPTWMAAIDGRGGTVLLAVRGPTRSAAARAGRALADRAGPATADLARRLAPARIAVTRVSRPGRLRRVVRRQCDDAKATLALERGGPRSRRGRGDLIKCVRAPAAK